MNNHLNELAKGNTKSSEGWTVDCESGSWAGNRDGANCENWFGWIGGNAAGSIRAIMNGSGRAELDFGNCYTSGFVKAYIDGNEIGSASGQEWPTVQFEFSHGSELDIIEEPMAILQFNSLKIIECNGNIHSNTVLKF